MKNIFFTLVFAFSAVAFADQPQPTPPPQQQPEVVEFNTYFNVFTCTKVQNSQDYSCAAASVTSEKASVALEKSADQDGVMVGTLSLATDVQEYKHLADVKVMKHTTQQQGTHYGFHVEETFYNSTQQMPDAFDHTYGAVHAKTPADLNEVTFYGRILRTENKLYIPVLVMGPATSTPQQRVIKVNPQML